MLVVAITTIAYINLLSNELEAEIRLTVDELMREELKNLKLVYMLYISRVLCEPVSHSIKSTHNNYDAFTYGVYMYM